MSVILKSKKWFPISATKEFNYAEIGETYVTEPEQALNKTVSISLGELTNDIKRQNVILLFRITDFKDNKLNTESLGYHLITFYVRKFIKSSKDKISDSFICITKDNVSLRVKPLILLKHKTQKSKLSAIRKIVRNGLINSISRLTFIESLDSLISFRLQRDLQKEIHKIYPIAGFLVRYFKKESVKGQMVPKEEAKEEPVLKEVQQVEKVEESPEKTI